jgi:apolipoprotein N-acyltransferase
MRIGRQRLLRAKPGRRLEGCFDRNGADVVRGCHGIRPSMSMLDRGVEGVKRATGWRRNATLFAAGCLSMLAFAPFHVWPVLWLTLPVLVWSIDCIVAAHGEASVRSSWRDQTEVRAAMAGWWFGFGYFFAGLFWIGEAFLVEAEVFAWALPFAVTLLPAGLALFFAGAAAVASRHWPGDFRRVAVLAIALSVAEWLRGHVLSGFPWNILGYAVTSPLPLMQSAAWLSVYALTFVVVIVFAGPLVLTADGMRWSRAVALATLPIALLWVLGEMRLRQTAPDPVAGVRLRIVQPSIPQREKWQAQHQRRNFDLHLELSREPATGAGGPITHIIWPEAAMPFAPLAVPAAIAAIGDLLPPKTYLISGALRFENADRPKERQVFNSLMVFADGGSLVALYDKNHLVPFGEYLPLQSVLEAVGLTQLVRMPGGFASGPRPRPLMSVPGLPPVSPLVCYEAIFPGAIVQGRERPGVMINVTNDGWFGRMTGPYQHLHQARVRAVEEGVPMIRAANNGVSAIVDAYGRVLDRLELDVRGAIDSPLPGAILVPLAARFGDVMFAGIMLLAIAILAVLRRKVPRGDNVRPPFR